MAIRDKLISAGVKNLKEFGYPDVDEKNILTDSVYSAFFLSMLKDNVGYRNDIDLEINKLMNECKPTDIA